MTAVELGLRMRERRRDLGLTQEALADLAGCSPRLVRLLETGRPGARLDKLQDVLETLGLELRLTPRGGTDA